MNKKIKRSRPLSRRKYAKTIEEAFEMEENEDKRIIIPEFRIKLTNLEYIYVASRRRGVSRSRFVEEMLVHIFTFTMLDESIFFLEKGKPRCNTRSNKIKYKVVPKFSIQPSIIKKLRRLKEERGVSFSLLFDEIFLIYRGKYPIYLNNFN